MKRNILSILMSILILTGAVWAPIPARAAGLDQFQKTQTYVTGQYADVPAHHPFAENVQAGYEYGIMQGYGSAFGVKSPITRLASIIVACRLNCIYETGINDIEETDTGTTQEIYLRYARNHGIYANFTEVAQPASRAEFAAILSSALPEEALAPINQVEEYAIPDVQDATPFASAIYRLYRAGILNGSDARGTFHPTANITRGAACAIATRMCSPTLRKSVTLLLPQAGSFDLSSIPAFSGKPYVAVNGNEPLFTEQEKRQTASFEQYAPLDSLGRCGVSVANIGRDLMPTEERGAIGQVKPSGWHTVKYDCVDGKYLYNRCHLIGYQLTAENANARNLITGTRFLNIEGMLPFENMTADYIRETGNHVRYRVTPVFQGNNLVASGVLMEGWSVEDGGEGICFHVFCYNAQPGVKIDYATGNSASDPLGVPDIQPTPEPKPTPEGTPGTGLAGAYVLNTNTMKFHVPSCSSVRRMNPSNRKEYRGSRAQLIAGGYDPCGICHP